MLLFMEAQRSNAIVMSLRLHGEIQRATQEKLHSDIQQCIHPGLH
jgi:hypothetical protein